jgi:hypothetical protein
MRIGVAFDEASAIENLDRKCVIDAGAMSGVGQPSLQMSDFAGADVVFR